jgi:hypothetical protein
VLTSYIEGIGEMSQRFVASTEVAPTEAAPTE